MSKRVVSLRINEDVLKVIDELVMHADSINTNAQALGSDIIAVLDSSSEHVP